MTHFLRAAHVLGALAVCVTAAACTPVADGSAGSLEESIAAPRAGTDVASSRTAIFSSGTRPVPLVDLPPDAARVVSVHTHDYVDGLRQEIALDGGAPNAIVVLARTSRRATLDEAVPLAKPTESAIRSEIGATFPHLPMQIVSRASANAFGPYGLALGRAGGDRRCMFMWQWIDADRLPVGAAVEGPVSLRVRFCRDGSSFDEMAAMLDHMSFATAASVATAAVAIAEPAPEIHPARRHHSATRHVPQPRVAQGATLSAEPAAHEKMHYTIAPPLDAPGTARASLVVPPRATPGAPSVVAASDLPPEALRGPMRRASASE